VEIEVITAEMAVEDLLTRYPATARVFVRHRMACVGCDVARFESIVEVCQTYKQSLDVLLDELRQAARAPTRRVARALMKEVGCD
jgi:hybrid cluster-associated redox disulfide protein